MESVRDGDPAAVRSSLAHGADVNGAEADGSTALHWAARLDRPEMVRALLAAGADVNAATRYNITPLSLAAENGSAAVIDLLLDAGADPNGVSEEGQTALMLAARNGRVDAVRTLLVHGAKVNAVEPYRGQTALMWAAGAGNTQALELLIEYGALVTARSPGGFTALLAAAREDQMAAAKILLEHGADANDISGDGTSALNVAVVNAHYGVASLLLDFGADPNTPDARGSPLHTIAWLRKPGTNGAAGVGTTPTGAPLPTGGVTGLELAQKLLDHGADPNRRIDWQEYVFNKEGGAVRNPPDIVIGRHLLTYNGASPFYIAAKNGDVAYMRLLAANGADPALPNRFGVTPLMVAAGMDYWEGETPGPFAGTSEAERLEAVKLAVKLGNDVNAHADFGTYPMTGDPEYTLLYYPHNIDDLLTLGAGDPRWNGCTALHGAVVSNQPSIVEYLIEAGADPEATNQLGWTPLMMSRGVFFANAKKEFPAAEKILTRVLAERGRPPQAARVR